MPLPTPGGSKDKWGKMLNYFLTQSHTEDGDLLPEVIAEIRQGLADGADLAELEGEVTALDGDLTIEKGKIAAAQTDLTRLKTQRYDIRDGFGTISQATNAATFNAAIVAINAAGGGFLTGPKDTYQFLAGITLLDGVFLDFPIGTVFDFTGATVSGIACIYGAGSLTALPDLVGDVARDDTSLIFATAPTIAADDVALIYNPTDSSFAPHRTYYRDGEFVRIRSLASATATITRGLYASHEASVVDVYKVNPIRTGVSGLRIVGIQDNRAITIDLGTDLRFDDLVLSGSNYSHLELRRCFDVHISNVKARDYSSETAGLNYGISLVNCQSVYLDNVWLETSRHGLTTTGDNEVGCVPCRDIRISDSYVGGHSSGAGINGLGLHGNTEWTWITNCTLPNGYMFSGDKVFLDRCDVSGGRTGFCVFPGETLGVDHHFTRCTFRATKNHTASNAFLRVFFNDTGMTRTGGVFTFTDNTVDFGPYKAASGTTIGLQIETHSDGDLPAANDILVARNRFVGTAAADGTVMVGVSVRARVGRAFRRVQVTGNTGNRGVWINEVGPEYMDLSGNKIEDASNNAIWVTWPAVPIYSACLIEIADTTVLRAQRGGISIAGAADTTLIMDQVTSLNCNQAGGAATTDASVHVTGVGRFIRRNCTLGDIQGTTTLNRLDSVASVTEFVDEANRFLGTVTTRALTSITTHEFHGSGAAAPSLSCADGSTYRRIGAGLYHRKGGAWVAL